VVEVHTSLRRFRQARFGGLVRRCVVALAAVLIAGVMAACGSEPPQSTCTGGLERYKDHCVTHTTVAYLGCVEAKDKNLTQGFEIGAELPAAADSTVKLAYTRAQQDDSAAALQFVKDCLSLAKEWAGSGKEADAASSYEKKAGDLIKVVKQKLPAIELDASGRLDCGSAAVGGAAATCQVKVTSTGVVPLQVKNIETAGKDRGDFRVGGGCAYQKLEPNESCVISLEFTPSAAGPREATLIVHQNLPRPDRGTQLDLVGTGTGGSAEPALAVSVDTSAAKGAVTSEPSGIDCPGTVCKATFGSTTSVKLTATYAQGSGHVSWEGCDSTDGDSCVVKLTADRFVTAQLAP